MNDDSVETIRPLELLHRAAREVGAVVCLCSTADGRDTRGRRANADQAPSRHTRLVVVRPLDNPDVDRWRRLQRGELLAVAAMVDPGQSLDWYAERALLQLTSHLRRSA